MSDSMVNLILDWVPFLIFLGLLVFFLLRLRRSQQNYLKMYQACMEAQTEEFRRINKTLERIAVNLEGR